MVSPPPPPISPVETQQEEIPPLPPVEEEAPQTIPVPPSVEEPPADIPVPPPTISGGNRLAAFKKKNLMPVAVSGAIAVALGVGGTVVYDILTALPNPLEPLIDAGYIGKNETDKLGDLIYRCYDGYLDKDISMGDFPIIGELLMHAKTKGYKIPVTVLDGLVAAGAKPDMEVQVAMAKHSFWHLAVELGDPDVMRALARLGTPTESKYVLQAVKANNEALLRTFAEVGMDLNYRPDNSENTPLMDAVIAGNDAMVRLLIELKADPNLRKKITSDTYVSCVDIADSMGNENMLSLLLQSGAIPTGSVAERMVYDACESNSMETLSTLIETGVDVVSYVENPPDDRDHLCAVAIRNGNAEMLRFFLLMGGSPNTSVSSYGSLLCMATKLDKKDCVQVLLDAGAEPLLENKYGQNSINIVQDTENIDTEKMLLSVLNPAQRIRYNRELNKKCWDRSLMINIISKGNDIYEGKMKSTEYNNMVVDIICAFSKFNVALPYEDIEEMLQLEGQKDGLIRSAGVDYTLAGWAVSKGDIQLLDVLKRAGVDINAPGTKNGQSLVAIAVSMKKSAVLRKLIESGCDVNAADQTGKIPLCYATDAETIKILTDAGAEINATFGDKKQTVLMQAAAADNAELAQLLLAAGADSSLTNSEGHTACALAQAAGAHVLASRLRPAGTQDGDSTETFSNDGSTEIVAVPVLSDGALTDEFVNLIVQKRLNLLTHDSPSPEKFEEVFADEVKELKTGKMVSCDTLVAKARQIADEWPVRQLEILSVGVSNLRVEICYSMQYAKHSGQKISAYNKTVLQFSKEGKVVGMQETLTTGKRPSLSSKFRKFSYKGTKKFSNN